MSFSFFMSLLSKLTSRWPLFLYAATWTTLLTVTVAMASFWPEITFVWAISPSSLFSRGCESEASVRAPLDVPGEILCLPTHMFKRSKIDLIVPPVFAAVVVAGSAWIVRALGLFENDESP
ncbi:Forkhead box protein G [Melia azedarach]|uniref:Forkhead box protein G n=1 Tax=Melia azedarach TaxID=155640 RepID=A0ACC1X078_MELAZ|nr:Forkhead box protein G [Melia azedarach]